MTDKLKLLLGITGEDRDDILSFALETGSPCQSQTKSRRKRASKGEESLTDKLKLLLGITGEDRDDILSFALETATDMALGYCNLDELPPQLENTVVRMAADLYRSEGYGQAAVPQVAQSVARGDVTVNYGSGNNGNTAQITGGKSILDDYRAQLNAFRRLRW